MMLEERKTTPTETLTKTLTLALETYINSRLRLHWTLHRLEGFKQLAQLISLKVFQKTGYNTRPLGAEKFGAFLAFPINSF